MTPLRSWASRWTPSGNAYLEGLSPTSATKTAAYGYYWTPTRTRPVKYRTSTTQSDSAALMSEMRDRIASLERQLEQERQANSEHRRLLAAALERIPPQLEAPSEARESDVSPAPTDEWGEIREELGAERVRREMAESTLREGMAEEQRWREEAERERDDLRRELYARREPRESPKPGEEQQGRGEPRPATLEAQESAHRPWWRRIFGG
jgi:hypothetical protein